MYAYCTRFVYIRRHTLYKHDTCNTDEPKRGGKAHLTSKEFFQREILSSQKKGSNEVHGKKPLRLE